MSALCSSALLPIFISHAATCNYNSKIIFEVLTDLLPVVNSIAKQKYVVTKNDTVLVDRINNETLAFDNVFVLFSDSATYETSEYTECVLDTVSGGRGKYATDGKYIDITWTVTEEGLLFLDENGEKLTVNRGTSFISFVKSSQANAVTIK